MKKSLLIILLSLSSVCAFATHFDSGNITVHYVNKSNWPLTIKVNQANNFCIQSISSDDIQLAPGYEHDFVVSRLANKHKPAGYPTACKYVNAYTYPVVSTGSGSTDRLMINFGCKHSGEQSKDEVCVKYLSQGLSWVSSNLTTNVLDNKSPINGELTVTFTDRKPN